jgi:hypothetical protein
MGKGRKKGRGGEETRSSREVNEDYGRDLSLGADQEDNDTKCEGHFPVRLYMWEFGQNDPKRS